MSVFVVGLNGYQLMPAYERKARLLLEHGGNWAIGVSCFHLDH